VNLLEEEIDEVIFQTNQFLTDATFTGSQGPFWWILLAEFWDCLEPYVNQLLAAICSACPKSDGTKTGQKSDLSIQRAACRDALFRLPLHPSATKVRNCPVLTKNPGRNRLFSSEETHCSPGSEYRERYSKSGTLILRTKKVENFSNFILMANHFLCCHPYGCALYKTALPYLPSILPRSFWRDCTSGVSVTSSFSPDYLPGRSLRMPRFGVLHCTSILPSKLARICHVDTIGLSAKQAFSILLTHCNTIIYACLFKE
jgi:hypothetical protein